MLLIACANVAHNAYWKPLNVERSVRQDLDSVHTIGGWFDIFSQGTLRGYVGMSQKGATERARRGSHLVIGAWGHGSSQQTGDIDFGPTAHINELARTSYRPLYFASAGKANTNKGDGRLTWEKPIGPSNADRFRYDPNDPVPSLGGNNCCGTPTPAGPRDQRKIEGRQDVLIYTSDVLQEEMEVTGPVKVVLYASSDASDTDFVAKLVDVYPDGTSYNMAEGVLRTRYRESLSKPSLLKPGQVYRFEIDLVGTSVAFLKGHRIRVHVTSSHFPQFDRNPNTGATFGATTEFRVAQQSVYHDGERASHILLPVIPSRTVTSRSKD